MSYRRHAQLCRFSISTLCLAAALGCGDEAEGSSTEALGALESLGEYTVVDNTCGPHWDGVFALSANRIAQYGQGTDQIFFEPTDPQSASNRGRGSLSDDGNFSLQISFEKDRLVYQCSGSLDARAILMQCDASGLPRCYLSLAVDASSANGV